MSKVKFRFLDDRVCTVFQLYIQEYKSRKERKKMMSRMTLVTPPTWGPPHNPLAGPSNWIPPGPGMIGGDYDLFPNFPGRKFIVNQ